MPKATAEKEVTPAQPEAPKGEREARWEGFLVKYKTESPVKYQLKKDRGEFDKIPSSFK
jgi:hypothetical protein